jgi:hypothetical protein
MDGSSIKKNKRRIRMLDINRLIKKERAKCEAVTEGLKLIEGELTYIYRLGRMFHIYGPGKLDDKQERYWQVYVYIDYFSEPYISLDLYLGKNDSIGRNVSPIIEHLENNFYWSRKSDSDNPESFQKTIIFTHIGKFYKNHYKSKRYIELKIYLHLKNSGKCVQVPTGEFTEKMKLECKE